MPTATVTGPAGSVDQLFLRWRDDPALPIQEQCVEVVGHSSSEPIIRSALRVDEKTKVFLIGDCNTKNGIVRSCRKDGESFLLTILIDSELSEAEYDPGLLCLDDFLTEEEESKILEGLSVDNSVCRESSLVPEKIGFVLRKFLTNLVFVLQPPSIVGIGNRSLSCPLVLL